MGDPKNGTTAALTEDVLAPVHYSQRLSLERSDIAVAPVVDVVDDD